MGQVFQEVVNRHKGTEKSVMCPVPVTSATVGLSPVTFLPAPLLLSGFLFLWVQNVYLFSNNTRGHLRGSMMHWSRTEKQKPFLRIIYQDTPVYEQGSLELGRGPLPGGPEAHHQ